MATGTDEEHGKGDTGLLHIINDLRGSNTFCDRPYVKDGPKARFYAGVPIITPSGLRIGAYCALDDKPREGLKEDEAKFLVEMGKTVMTHLETVRERAEFGRGTRMLKGLRSFVQTATSRRVDDTSSRTVTFADKVKQDVVYEADASTNPKGTPIAAADETVIITCPTPVIPAPASDGAASPTPDVGSLVGSESKALEPEDDVATVFSNAAALVREAMDAEGCLFLDVTADKPLAGDMPTWHRRTASEHSTGAVDTGSEQSDSARVREPRGRFCSTLGQSRRAQLSQETKNGTLVPSATLQRMLRRYPRGKIWNFNAEGDVLSSDQLTDTHVKQPRSLHIEDAPRRRRTRSKWSASDDAAELRSLFPDVRSLCLVGMWDLKTQRWRAGFLVWSNSPVRVFSVRGELSYIVAFGEVIMGEIAAIEARREEKKRSDFVSSISHELRSPLHGILGSIDMLNQDNPALSESINFKQIEGCTLTMLDLVEHLLSFAEYKQRHRKRPISSEDPQTPPDSDDSLIDRTLSVDLSPGISIAKATEEICDVLFHSHSCDTVEAMPKRIEMALDIALGPEYFIRAGAGDWKRLCGNVISNAFKFTDRGHVSVSLRLSKKRKRTLAVLEVSDTGCGMSPDFINDGLFRAFRQEDGLRVGMGLGMALANKIVRGLGGQIQAYSQPNVGTTFKITVPVEVDADAPNIGNTPSTLCGVKLCMESMQIDNQMDEALDASAAGVKMAFRNTCERLGAEMVSKEEAQTMVISDVDFRRHAKDVENDARLLVLCRDARSVQKAKEVADGHQLGQVAYMQQPFGPRRVSHSLSPRMSRNYSPQQQSDVPFTTKPHGDASTQACLTQPFAAIRLSPTPAASTELGSTTQAGDDSEPGAESPRWQIITSDGNDLAVTTTDVTDPGLDGAAAARAPVNPVPSTEPPSPRKLSLLLVDDNPVNLRLLVTYANKNQHPRHTATNGKEAVDVYATVALDSAAATPKPDVILLDINMPVMDGFEAARCIRSFESEYDIPPAKIIALTGLGSDVARKEAVLSGVDMFLTKPVRMRELKPILEGIVRGR
ncbi:Hybrid signal transduction protein dokA [Sphaceloma murrayae]|uniref:Hybrid signal transduction protein dokA n=1 Tax=Sphaceloma murrayae TaxID=2082308 RepID=A0A2K1QZZ5_9PEZI|nr:Hybrid signal transduction protein dokA [Sphaceloma murrayae]